MSLLLLLAGVSGEGTPEPEPQPEITPPVGGIRWLPEPVKHQNDDNEWMQWWD